jgi:hypothetical protein
MRISPTTYDLFIQALNITNAALELHRDSLLLMPMLKTCNRELRGKNFGVEIYVESPDQPVDFFTIRLQGAAFVLVAHRAPAHAEATWTVSRDYLADVVTHPRAYINHPSLLAFDWLNQRLNVNA